MLRATPIAALAALASLAGQGCLYHSPGTLHASSTETLTADQLLLRDELRNDVEHLSAQIGPRNAAQSLRKVLTTERWILERLEGLGLEGQRDEVDLNGATAANVVVTFPGSELPDEILLLGAHYDTAIDSPGANDNASGVALLLATAGRLRNEALGRTVRIVFFVNEENPFSGGIQMGSRVHADRCRARGDDIIGMIGVDSIGYYTSEPGSQSSPLFSGLPSTGNFVMFIGNLDSKALLDRVVAVFQSESRFPSLGIATDMKAAARSDHAPFWWRGYPALAMSDTSERRDPHYHLPTDSADNLDYDELARLAEGFVRTVRALADPGTLLR